MKPLLPLLTQPPETRREFKFGHEHPDIRTKEDLEFARAAAGVTIQNQHITGEAWPPQPHRSGSHSSGSSQNGPMNSGPGPIRSLLYPEGGSTNLLKAITRRLSKFLNHRSWNIN